MINKKNDNKTTGSVMPWNLQNTVLDVLKSSKVIAENNWSGFLDDVGSLSFDDKKRTLTIEFKKEKVKEKMGASAKINFSKYRGSEVTDKDVNDKIDTFYNSITNALKDNGIKTSLEKQFDVANAKVEYITKANNLGVKEKTGFNLIIPVNTEVTVVVSQLKGSKENVISDKSKLSNSVPPAKDKSKEIFPTLTKEQKEYIEKIGVYLKNTYNEINQGNFSKDDKNNLWGLYENCYNAHTNKNINNIIFTVSKLEEASRNIHKAIQNNSKPTPKITSVTNPKEVSVTPPIVNGTSKGTKDVNLQTAKKPASTVNPSQSVTILTSNPNNPAKSSGVNQGSSCTTPMNEDQNRREQAKAAIPSFKEYFKSKLYSIGSFLNPLNWCKGIYNAVYGKLYEEEEKFRAVMSTKLEAWENRERNRGSSTQNMRNKFSDTGQLVQKTHEAQDKKEKLLLSIFNNDNKKLDDFKALQKEFEPESNSDKNDNTRSLK